MKQQEYRFFVGLDGGWSDVHGTIIEPEGDAVARRKFRYDGDEISKLADWILEVSPEDVPPGAIAVAIEVNRGAVVELLLERGFHVFALNPKQLDRFRDRHTVAGAKDDTRDADILADSLRTDRKCFKRLSTDDPVIIELRELVRIDVELGNDVTRLSNRLCEQIHRYFPQFLEFGSLASQPWLWELLELIPTPEKARTVPPRRIAALMKKHRIRRLTARQVSSTLRRKPLALAPGAVEAATSHVAYLLPRLRMAFEQRQDCERRMKQTLEQLSEGSTEDGERGQHRDVEVLLSCPGLGTRTVATMLAEANQPLAERSYRTLRSYGGIAPVSKRSGKKSRVTMRRACSRDLRRALYYWANVASQNDEHCKAHYAALRARGHQHGRALRSVADALLRMLCAMLRSGTLYDPALRRFSVAATA